MPLVTVTCHECIQDIQDIGLPEDQMFSRIKLTIAPQGGTPKNCEVMIKQTVGATYESTDPLEVGRPEGYQGPMDVEAFRAELEKYFRSLVGKAGGLIRIAGKGSARMRNNRFVTSHTFQFDAPPPMISNSW